MNFCSSKTGYTSILTPDICANFLSGMLEMGHFDGSIFRKNQGGHTPETLEVPNPGSGRESAMYWLLSRLNGKLTAEHSTAILSELEALIVEDTGSEHFGCMRWFKEESYVSDTNAAFFTLMPFLVTNEVTPDLLKDVERTRIKRICQKTLPWFLKECREPHFYYPNKVISDGAILWGVGTVLEDKEACTKASAFIRDWITYTREKGWGWGENISIGYIPVILVALRFLVHAAKQEPWHGELIAFETELMDIVRFCDGMECCPSIRSYNFSGKPQMNSVLWTLIGHPDHPISELSQRKELAWKSVLMLLLYAEELESIFYTPPVIPREMNIRIFEGRDAVAWAGNGIRLGSCQRFPVLSHHYQHEQWGLGWQSFPVSVLMEDLGVSRLQWRCEFQGRLNTHPTTGENGIHRNYRLIGDNDIASVLTHSVQKEHVAVVIRSVKNLVTERGEGLSDEWWLRNGAGKGKPFGGWWCLQYGQVTLAIQPLGKYVGSGDALLPADAVWSEEGPHARLTVSLLPETGKLQVVPRLEVAWLVAVFDQGEEEETLRHQLAAFHWVDEAKFEHSVPRLPYAYIRDIAVQGQTNQLHLAVDYHHDLLD